MKLKEIIDKEDFRPDLNPQNSTVSGMMISSKEDFERIQKLIKELAGTYIFVDVWNCRCELRAMTNDENGNGKTVAIDDWQDYLTEEDLVQAIEEHGGAINMSGHYPISDSIDRKIGIRLVFLFSEENKEMKIIPIGDGNSDFSLVELRDSGKE